MKKEINEELLKNAIELLNYPDNEILALALSQNDKWAENYLTAMNIKLRSSIGSLRKDIQSLKESMNISSWVMIILTIILVIFTAILIYLSPFSEKLLGR